jgi:hypothetical protein
MPNLRDPRIFISYRRDDSERVVKDIYQGLKQLEVPAYSIFFDRQSISPGDRWKERLQASLEEADQVLAVIGPIYTSITQTGQDRPRLFDPEDYVRMEIAEALAQGKTIVPVLVGGATLPQSEQLPPDMHALLDHQAIELHADSFRKDLKTLANRTGLRKWVLPWYAYVLIFLGVIVIAYFLRS